MVLPYGSSVEDYRVFTESEKSEHESRAEAYKEPTQDLLDWVEDSFGFWGRLDAERGMFSVYDDVIDDLTVEDMRLIRVCSDTRILDSGEKAYARSSAKDHREFCPRTFPPLRIANYNGRLYRAFYNQSSIEAIGWFGGYASETTNGTCNEVFYGYSKLHTIAPIVTGKGTFANAFTGCDKLVNVRLITSSDVSFADSPDLSMESIMFLVENAVNTSAITVTLHKTAFARLDTSLKEAAAQKNIIFTTP